jgi:Cu(I)/Ag(I) efflux system membrane protein CusA/SilA
MIARFIEACVRNRFLVLLIWLMITAWGIYAAYKLPVDAIPDLSDTQVIISTNYPGQAPQVVEDQVTYPLTTAMLAVPQAKAVRGYSLFGLSLVYIIFEDGTDIYWARTRVLEYLNFIRGKLPSGVNPALGPDATGVGWVYEYVVEDPTGKHDLAQLRSIQDWYLRYQLQTVPGVAEVASIGGFVKQYQVVVDPNKAGPIISPSPKSSKPSRCPTRTWEAASLSRPRPNLWSVGWATSRTWRTSRTSWWAPAAREPPC